PEPQRNHSTSERKRVIFSRTSNPLETIPDRGSLRKFWGAHACSGAGRRSQTRNAAHRAANFFDFAVLVTRPDDVVTSRGKKKNLRRAIPSYSSTACSSGGSGLGRAFIACEE